MSKKELPIKNGKCLRNGCAAWQQLLRFDPTGELKECERCGFNVQEDARRKEIPLTLCADGLRRKIIPPKPIYGESVEDAEEEEDSEDE